METEHFGSFLKVRRVALGMSIAELSRATKIKERSLELLEEARLDALPATVFVRGFVSAYARHVGADETDALARLERALGRVGRAVVVVEGIAPAESDELPARRRYGVALVVLLLLIVATLTLSLLLRHGGAPGGLS